MGASDDDYQRDDSPTVPSKKIKEQRDGCCMRIFKKVFFKLYPSHIKYCWTSQGDWLRKMILTGLCAHILFFVLALALVGFQTMLTDLFLAAVCYSCYLTMNECSVIVYIFFLMASCFTGLIYGMAGKQSFQTMGLLANVATDGALVFFVAKSYYYFKKNGGIKGDRSYNQKNEKRLAKALEIGTLAAGKLEEKLDKDNLDEKQRDDDFKAMQDETV